MNRIKENIKLVNLLFVLFILAIISLFSIRFFLNETQNKQHVAFLNEKISWIEKNYHLDNPKQWKKTTFNEIADQIETNQTINFFDPVGDPLDGSKAKLTPTITSIIQSNHDQANNSNKQSNELYVARAVLSKNGRVGIIQIKEPLGRFYTSFNVLQAIILIILVLLFIILAVMLTYLYLRAQQPIKYALPVIEEMIDHPEKQQKLAFASNDWAILYEKLNLLMKQTNSLYYQQLFNEEKLDYILDQLDIGVMIFNHRSNEKKLNQVAQDLYYKANGFKQELETLFSIMLTDVQTTLTKQLSLTFPNEKILNIVIHANNYQVKEESEYIVIIYDITTIKTIERAHKDFIRNVSHELKTPTTAIVGFTETLNDNPNLDQQTREKFTAIINKEGKRLDKLIQNILELMKTDVNTQIEAEQKVAVSQVMEDELAHYKVQIAEKMMNIVKNFDQVEQEPIFSEFYLQPIVKNLIENALVYSEQANTLYLEIRITADFLFFSIRDEGRGIPKEEQTRIFETFYRVSTSRQRASGGTGLGLSIVKNAVQQLNGQIFVESEENKGTCFTVKLPILVKSKI